MNHSFDIDHARLYGIPEAILISNFQFWIARNKANGENLREGRTWTYNSVKAFKELFPYLSIGQVRRALERLVEEHGVLVTANHNESACDRTLWYAFFDESIFLSSHFHLSNSANGSGKGGKSLKRTDVNADGKPDSSAARGSRLPKDWILTKAWGEEALAIEPTWSADHCRFQADKFRDYWVAVSGKAGVKLDWLATWRNWVRNAGPMPGAVAPSAAAVGNATWWQSADGIRTKGAELGLAQEEARGELFRSFRIRVLKKAGPGAWREEFLKEISRDAAEHERVLAYFDKPETQA